jgi:hypothetical protein
MNAKTEKPSEAESIDNSNSDSSPSKRSVLDAVSAAPLIVVISLPRFGYAANVSDLTRQHRKPQHDKVNYHPHKATQENSF